MCRMFGMVAASPASAREALRDAPRGLRSLAREHADGWGIAVRGHGGWIVHRGTSSAASCERYAQVAAHVETTLAIAHVRKATVGELSLANTHPFQRDELVFAHNGTVSDLPAIVMRCSRERLREVEGDTDSERLFAFVLTFVDALGVDRGVAAAVRALHALGDIGSVSFLLSCGSRLYAHRLGRTLFTLDRGDVRLVASERFTDEPWQEVPERALVVLAVDDHRMAA